MNARHQLAAGAKALVVAGDEEVVDVAAGLEIGIGNDLTVMLDDEGCQLAHAFRPYCHVHLRRRPRAALCRGVVTCADQVDGGVEHAEQRGLVAGTEQADAHGNNGRQMVAIYHGRYCSGACATGLMLAAAGCALHAS